MSLLLKRLVIQQWPFWLGGLFVGLAEILVYLHTDMFIIMTTGLARMYAVSETYIFGIDWVAQVYKPGIQWIDVGTILGARLVVLAEKESRAWVHYHWRMMLLAFLGGFLFSFGTRIAGGCTTHHFIGGLASMSIASWVVLFTGIPFAFLAFRIAMWVDMGGYFRHQETHRIAQQYRNDPEQPQPGYKIGYRPWRDPLRLFLNVFLFMFFITPLYFAVFTDKIIGSAGKIGWIQVAWLVFPSMLLGIGIAKTGFGTECAIMAPESMLTKPGFYRTNGVPMATYRMFRGLLPLQGFLTAIVSFNLCILISWLTGYGNIPNAAGEQGLYWGHILGGPFLAMGAVFMIGCEVRTYARLGMGYGTALAALPGFYLGYLPYTFYKARIDAMVFDKGLTDYITLPQWMAGTLGGSEAGWSIVYSLCLIGLLIFSFEWGRRFLKVSMSKLFYSNADELIYRTPT